MTKYEAPLNRDLAQELFEFWQGIFPGEQDVPIEVFLGSETAYNRAVVYLTRCGDKVAGTCGTTTSLAVPALAGFGEVATAPEHRGQGISTRLCGQAVADFRENGGEAFFLGTGNPAAARVYHRLGWRKLAGANVMANISSGDSPAAFLVEYFRARGSVAVLTATPAVRIPMIPLILAPHDWQVLDANALMYSTRYKVQHSCMGLYRRYYAVVKGGRAEWFAARTPDRRVVGLATARLDDSGECHVDGFTHKLFMDSWSQLMRATLDWGESRRASIFTATVSVEDEEKRALFESLGFVSEDPGPEFELDGRSVASVRLARTARSR